jgi:hypothetical protein
MRSSAFFVPAFPFLAPTRKSTGAWRLFDIRLRRFLNPDFSCSYKTARPQPFCFDNHAKPPGVAVSQSKINRALLHTRATHLLCFQSLAHFLHAQPGYTLSAHRASFWPEAAAPLYNQEENMTEAFS